MKLTATETNRRFAIVRFVDLYNSPCSIQKSSLADADAIWFGVDDAAPKILASRVNKVNPETGEVSGWVPYGVPDDVNLTTRMHLTRDQVRSLLPILQGFVATGKLPNDADSLDKIVGSGPTELPRFALKYRCLEDKYSWSLVWTSSRNDRCPKCGKEIAPRRVERI